MTAICTNLRRARDRAASVSAMLMLPIEPRCRDTIGADRLLKASDTGMIAALLPELPFSIEAFCRYIRCQNGRHVARDRASSAVLPSAISVDLCNVVPVLVATVRTDDGAE